MLRNFVLSMVSFCSVALFLPNYSLAQGIDSTINEILSPISDAIVNVVFYSIPVGGTGLPLIVVWLILGAVFCTLYFGFINVRGFRLGFDLVRGKGSDDKAPGEVSHFQALSTACAATVGLGNIAGVAVAVAIGGPGATFWMIVAGLLGMSLKFCECTLGVKYRIKNADGSISGGPMYYLSQGLSEKGLKSLGKYLAIFFSICCIGGALGGGNMFQANQSFQQFVSVTGGEDSFFADKGWLFGLVLATLLGVVIIGGITRIAKVTEKLVPFMAIIYLLAALVIILTHITQLPAAFGLIISGAFSPEGVAGGFVGVLVQGFKRAAFSNEAGLGSAPIAHSAVKTNFPATEGLVSLLEPFIDTVVICTMTALVIVITGMYSNPANMAGIELTSAAFESAIPWFPYVLALAAVLFAFSTMISWSYYGLKSWTFLVGHSHTAEISFKLVYCLFVILGATMSLGPVINIADSMIFLMSLANLIGVYLLASVVKKELEKYIQHIKSD